MTSAPTGRYPSNLLTRHLGPTDPCRATALSSASAAAPPLLEQPAVAVDAIAHLDEDWSVPCDAVDEDGRSVCSTAATWWLVCTACGHAFAECNPHRVAERCLWESGLIDTIACRDCPAEVNVRLWRDLFQLHPIGGRS